MFIFLGPSILAQDLCGRTLLLELLRRKTKIRLFTMAPAARSCAKLKALIRLDPPITRHLYDLSSSFTVVKGLIRIHADVCTVILLPHT